MDPRELSFVSGYNSVARCALRDMFDMGFAGVGRVFGPSVKSVLCVKYLPRARLLPLKHRRTKRTQELFAVNQSSAAGLPSGSLSDRRLLKIIQNIPRGLNGITY